MSLRNADGRLEIFYTGTGNHIYHNWQTTAGSPTWFGETPFPGNSAKQIAVEQNTDGRLEIFYVDANNAIYHNWQTGKGSTQWFGETRFAGDSAQQIAVGLSKAPENPRACSLSHHARRSFVTAPQQPGSEARSHTRGAIACRNRSVCQKGLQ